MHEIVISLACVTNAIIKSKHKHNMTIAFNCRDGRYGEFPQAQNSIASRETLKAKWFFISIIEACFVIKN